MNEKYAGDYSFNNTFDKGQEFTVTVFLDTQNQLNNAIEGNLVFDNNLLEVKKFDDANSIINFWITRPSLAKGNTINFSGIIPGGYQGKKGFIFSVVFVAKNSGNGAIAINNAKVLLNDGKGTSANLATSPYKFSISNSISTSPQIPQPLKDTQIPEEFKPIISRSSDLFDSKWFVVFATQDKESGIDHYEIREGTSGNFSVAQSPQLLQNQALDKEIFIKAVDKSGNERLETFYPSNWKPWYKNYWIFVILILVIVISTVFLWKKLKK